MNSRLHRALLIGMSILIGGSAASCASVLSPQAVEQSYATRGIQTTLQTYFSCDTYEGSAYERIATGAESWVSLAEKLIVQTDGCYTEGLQAALGDAMRKAPARVLRLVDKTPTLGAEYICLPFISSELPVKAQLREVEASRRAIGAVGDGRVSDQKAACLRFIDEVAARLTNGEVEH